MGYTFSAYTGSESYVFVSYAHADEALVYPEIEWLHEQGFNVWYDERIGPGTIWRDEIAESISKAALFLYFITPNSIERPHCQREVAFAMDREIPLLAVHLQETMVPGGMELSLNSIQAILRYRLSEDAYRAKLLSAANQYLVPAEGHDETEHWRKPAGPGTYRFGDWEVNPQRNELRREGETKRLEPKVSDVLWYLLEHPGEIVSAEELMDAVWPGRAIEIGGVARNIAQIRRALGDDSQHPSYIETIPKRGYRTLAPVQGTPAPAANAIAEPEVAVPATAEKTVQNTGLRANAKLLQRNNRFPIGVGAALLALMLGIAWYMVREPDLDLAGVVGKPVVENKSVEANTVIPPGTAIAVLPFDNFSPDPNNAYFAAGIYEETLNQLAKIKGFSVIARVTVGRYADGEESIAEIGQELNVSAVMSGSVRFAGDRVRVTAQLVDVGTGTQRWSEIYDRNLDDIFSIQSDIAESITRAMEISFDLEARESIAAIPTENLEAYSAYLKGLAALNHVPSRVPDGVRELDTAIRLDPTFADALGLNALYRATMSLFQSPTPEAEAENLELAQSLAQRALALSPRQSSALASLSYVALAKRRWDEQIAYAREAYELDPNGKLPAYLYAEALSSNGNADEARPLFDRAIALNPLNPNLARNAANGMAVNGRWNEARRYARAAIEAGPDAWVFYALAAWVEANTGNVDEATALLKAAEARFPSQRSIPLGLNAGLGRLIATYTLTGQHDAANRELQKLINQQPDNDAGLFFAYWDLGMLDKALDHAHAAVEKGFPAGFISFLAQRWDSPTYKPLHGHPRYFELLDKIGLDHKIK